MKGTSCVRRVRLRSVCLFFAALSRWLQAALAVLLCVRSYRVFWNLWLQIAVEWLHECCRCHVCRYVRVCCCETHCHGCMNVAWALFGEVANRSGMAAWMLSRFVVMCVDTCRFATWCCVTRCNGCMNVAWILFWGGSRSTKPCIFPCKVAAGGDASCVRRVRLRSVCLFSRMRSKGSRFTLGVWGLRVCSLDVAFVVATVRNRAQPFATVRAIAIWPCLC